MLANATTGNLSIFLNHGNGLFARPLRLPGTPPSSPMTAADVNEDGHIDLVIPSSARGTVSVILNATVRRDLNTNGIPDECEDCNANGRADEFDLSSGDAEDCNANAVPDECDVAAVFRLESRVRYNVSEVPRSAAPIDLNFDSYLDLVVTDHRLSRLSVLFSNGDGTFAEAVSFFGRTADNITAADLDDDGDFDLAVTVPLFDRIDVLLNVPHDEFPFLDFYWHQSIDVAEPSDITSGDFNRDGTQDLAVTNWFPASVLLFFSRGDADFMESVEYDLPGSGGSINAADLDSDQDIDLMVTDTSREGHLSVLLNDGQGGFFETESYQLGDYPIDAAAGDLDNDGDVDVSVAVRGSDRVTVLLNTGDGTLVESADYPVGDEPFSIATGDLDHDGDLDLAVANLLSDRCSVLLNSGAGTFRPPIEYGTGTFPRFVAMLHLDDGPFPELVPKQA